MSKYQKILVSELGLNHIEPWKQIGRGNDESWAFKSDDGTLLFTKISSSDHARELLCGEYAALEALEQTGVVHVPKPKKVIHDQGRSILVTEFLDFNGLNKFQGDLGHQLAKLHLHNMNLLKNSPEDSDNAVMKFGFSTTVCCGKIPIDNSWNEDWVEFYSKQRLKPQVEMLLRKYGCAELGRLWNELELNIDYFFQDISVSPSLLHGDLWSGNAGETENGPVIFDPASFYGHHEFDLAITRMFGGFRPDFYRRYHQLIPPEPGFEERKPLYELFHYLNHWNHFGGGYKEQSLNIMRKLVKFAGH